MLVLLVKPVHLANRENPEHLAMQANREKLANKAKLEERETQESKEHQVNKVILELRVNLERRVREVKKVQKVMQVLKEKRAREVMMVQQVLLVHQEKTVPLQSWENLVQLVLQVIPEPKANRDLLDLLERKVQWDLLAMRDQLVKMGSPENLDNAAHLGEMDRRERLDQRVQLALKENPDPKVPRVSLGQKAIKERWETQDFQDCRESREQPV